MPSFSVNPLGGQAGAGAGVRLIRFFLTFFLTTFFFVGVGFGFAVAFAVAVGFGFAVAFAVVVGFGFAVAFAVAVGFGFAVGFAVAFAVAVGFAEVVAAVRVGAVEILKRSESASRSENLLLMVVRGRISRDPT
jgi:hypothetical protein